MGKFVENGVMIQYFEWYLPADGTLWSSLTNKAAYLASRGVTSIWLPPAYKGAQGREDVGYGVYDHYDLGEFYQKGTAATKYGTKDEYLQCIDALQENGIDVYADIVLNHMMGADDMEEVPVVVNFQQNRMEEITPVMDIEAWTKFSFPGRGGKYSDFVWDASCFSGVDWDERSRKKEIYRFANIDWDEGVDRENVNYDYLMGADINFSNQRVRDELTRWGQWYLDTTHVNGFRLDAVKHIKSDFFGDWLYALRTKYNKTLFTVGEYWHQDVHVLLDYLDQCYHCMSLFDVPLHYNFFVASHSNGCFDMRNILKGTLVEADPTHAVTFVDNHDTQTGQALESAILDWFVPLAYAVILLRPMGYPCVFYGDYYGVEKFNDPGFSGELDVLMFIRRKKMYGELHDYFDHEDIIGWTLTGDEEHPDSGLAVVMTDRMGGIKNMYVGKNHAGEVWIDALGICGQEVTIDEEGKGLFTCSDGSCSVWVREDAEEMIIERFDDSIAPTAVHHGRNSFEQ